MKVNSMIPVRRPLLVILSKPLLRGEGSGRAARCGVVFALQ
jgi:hypothetical protein